MVEAFFGVHENKNKKGIMLYTYILEQKNSLNMKEEKKALRIQKITYGVRI